MAMAERFDPRFAPGAEVSGPSVFADMDRDAWLVSGRPIRIEPSTASDVERVRSFYDHLSETSAYYRFFGIRPALSDAELVRTLVQVAPRHIVLLATMGDEPIGIGEFTVGPDREAAEVAFAVADAHQREGVGTLLLERLAVIAVRCGLRRLVARTLPGNEAMRLVLRTVGLEWQATLDGEAEVCTLDLGSLEQMERAAVVRRQRARSGRTRGVGRSSRAPR